jgi:hypothetical protein
MTIDFVEKASLIKQGLVTGLSALLLAGCSISVPQVESSYKFVKAVVLSDQVSSEEHQAIWLASVGGRGAVLRPYLSGDLTVFANTDGDAIAFDGWTIRSVVGFGLAGPLSVSGKDGNRTFSVGGGITSAECDPWYLRGLTWRQTCSNGPGEIVLSEDGNIQKITMAIGNGSGIVTLRVAK